MSARGLGRRTFQIVIGALAIVIAIGVIAWWLNNYLVARDR
jgi:hypothetical protein